MYGWLWRHLPGPVPVKVLLALLLFLAIVLVLFVWVFPDLVPRLPISDPTLEGTGAAGG
jgi:hypothetical protein